LENGLVDYELFNKAMYTAISRAVDYAAIVGEKHVNSIEDSELIDNMKKKREQETKDRVEEYIEADLYKNRVLNNVVKENTVQEETTTETTKEEEQNVPEDKDVSMEELSNTVVIPKKDDIENIDVTPTKVKDTEVAQIPPKSEAIDQSKLEDVYELPHIETGVRTDMSKLPIGGTVKFLKFNVKS